MHPKVSHNSAESLDNRLCTVDGSRVQFRGPLPQDGEAFVAVLGGNETFGKHVNAPYPALLSELTCVPVANLGVVHAGLSLFSEEELLLDLASKAEVTVLQILGPQNMSNRLYSVHSRRNDRFLGVSPALRDLYPDVDFAEINFTGHLLAHLQSASAASFDVVVNELKWAWLQRMRRVLSLIKTDVVLLWISDRSPSQTQNSLHEEEPRFVDQTMIDALISDRVSMVEVLRSSEASLKGKIYLDDEVEAARILPSPADHARIAERLAVEIAGKLGVQGRDIAAALEQSQSFSISSGTAVKRSATRP